MRRWVYFLEDNLEVKDKEELKAIMGGKGAGLYLMAKMGLPVPPFFIISTRACLYFLKEGIYPDGLEEEVREGIEYLEERTKKTFGESENPLLLSVRSGSKFSMPGMMDTILNLGLNDRIVSVLSQKTGEDFAYGLYQRFIEIFARVVFGIKIEGLTWDKEGSSKEAALKYKEIIQEKLGREFPQDVFSLLFLAITAVFNSWNNPRAKEYRRIYQIPDDLGTAVNIQAMVFGNRDEKSGTGVLFTRDPATGEKGIYGDFLLKAQGEDLVAGIRNPEPITAIKKYIPEVYPELEKWARILEEELGDMQDVEFTIESSTLYFLQTRSAKRSPQAKLKVLMDKNKLGRRTKEEVIMEMTPEDLSVILNPVFDPNFKYETVGRGVPASPGCATGELCLSSEEALIRTKRGKKVILVREFTSADDIAGMEKAEGFLTTTGGKTSHAAVVARGMGKPCIVGASEIKIQETRKIVNIGGCVLKEGDFISINGSTGEIVAGKVPLVEPKVTPELKEFLNFCSSYRRMGVRANADKPKEALWARELGAEGIGLARTEHMFFHPERIKYFQMMILADSPEERRRYLAELLPFQKEDFKGLFKAMAGLPVTIRTLDPPLHEFLPTSSEEIEKLADNIGVAPETIAKRVRELKEQNPMMGLRGCRLGIMYPEITEMQVRAIFLATSELKKEGVEVFPEIMIPLTVTKEEIKNQRLLIDRVASEIFAASGIKVDYLVGTMIEVPRACLTASSLVPYTDFFSFGTNDLTQFVFGFSRDDYTRFIPTYLAKGILREDPFASLDIEGIGRLIEMAVREAREIKKDFKIGICGQHGGDPRSIEFCRKVGFDYVSCDASLVPIAILAAAQAEIKLSGEIKTTDLTR